MRIIGLDLGTKTLGIAVSDPAQILASPVTTLRFTEPQAALSELFAICAEYQTKTLCLGLPKRLDGSLGAQAEFTLGFAEKLSAAGYEVIFVDERLSTVAAARALAAGNVKAKKQKHRIDQSAACIILQSYLDWKGARSS